MPTVKAFPLRADLEPLPARLAHLPVDARGYPVPWFVEWINGLPEFRNMDGAKFKRAVREKRCWICGDVLGRFQTFVIGPMCAVNRVSAEPPSHTECARYAARNCPFLVRPHMTRRLDEQHSADAFAQNCAGTPLLRNPGVALLWTTHGYRVFFDPKQQPLLKVGDPVSVEWYAEGRPATRAEVLASIDGGLPQLEAVARAQGPDALHALQLAREAVTPLLPAD